MRIATVILLLILLSLGNLKAQDEEVNLKLRHIKGIKGIDLGYGISKFGNYYSVGYVHFLSDVYILNPTLRYESGNINLTNFNEYTLSISFQRNILKVNDFIFINGGIGPCVQIQQTKNDVLNKNENLTPIGASLDLNIEIYILNNLVIRGEFMEVYSYNDQFGSFRYLTGGGLRIYF